MAEGLHFGVTLENHVSKDAEKAAESIRKLSLQLGDAKEKLVKYETKLKVANELGNVAGHEKFTEAVKATKRRIDELTISLTKAHRPQKEMGEGFIKVVEPAEIARHAIEGVSNGLKSFVSGFKGGEAKEMVAGLAESLAGLASTLDLVVPGLGQAASAAIKMEGAIIGAFVGIAQEGVKTALEVTAVNEKLEKTFEALGSAPGAGKKTLEFLNTLSGQLPQSRDQLAQWTKQFQAFGITDLGELRQQIKATASAQAIAGESGASAYESLAEKIKDAVQGHHKLKMGRDVLKGIAEAGGSAEAVAAKLGISVKQLDAGLQSGSLDAQKFGNALSNTLIERGKGPLEAMGNELSTLGVKAKETWGHLFDDLDTSPITDGIKSVIALGDQGTPSGKALKAGITSALQGIINFLGKMITEAEVMFLELELYAIKSKPELKAVAKAFGDIGDAVLAVTHGIEFLFDHAPPAWLLRLVASGATGGLISPVSTPAKANAAGGLVGRPAPGEFMASVSPGEMILPAREARQLSGNALGGAASMVIGGAAQNDNGGGGVQIGNVVINITAPQGVTDAHQLSVTGLTLALERYQLASGR